MAAFRDDMSLIAGVNENWDEDTTRSQIVRPDWDFSPIHMQTMHHLPHIFFDTLRPERPDCPVLVPSSFSLARDRIISQDIPHHIQILPRSVRDLGRLCNRRAHALHQYHRPQNQRSAWRCVTNR